ncbi:MAG: gliding motility-associated C-terminal domain-containing protein [Bacteroidota bacterium]
MMKRSAKTFPVYLISLFIIVFSGHSSYAQDATTGIQGGVLCPFSEFTTPILVTGLQDIDSISLTLSYPPQTLTYEGYGQINGQLQSGFLTVNQVDTTIRITWHSEAPISISDGTLISLTFLTGISSGSLSWDEATCYYRKSNGMALISTYTGDNISFHPAIIVEIEEINQTCASECEANIFAVASGGEAPFDFEWDGGILDVTEASVVIENVCGGNHFLKITDANNCVLDSVFVVTELPATNLELETHPDTVYLENPVVSFSFTENQDIVSWEWDFGDGSAKSRERNPIHKYELKFYSFNQADSTKNFYEVKLEAVNNKGCDTLIEIKIPISDVKLFIPSVFTPPTDPNGFFRVAKVNTGSSGSKYMPVTYEYQRMELFVLDRWGRKVFDDGNYHNNWDGGNLPDGTYYYKLNTYGYFNNRTYTGAVTIIREK